MERIVSFRERARRAAVAAAAAAGNSENAARVRASTIANAEAWLLSECTKVVDVLGGEEMDFEVKQNSSGNFILGEKTSLGGAGGTSIVKITGDYGRQKSLRFIVYDHVESEGDFGWWHWQAKVPDRVWAEVPLTILPVIVDRTSSLQEPIVSIISEDTLIALRHEGNAYTLLPSQGTNWTAYTYRSRKGVPGTMLPFKASEWLDMRTQLEHLFRGALDVFVRAIG
jgi:hypothetical protein